MAAVVTLDEHRERLEELREEKRNLQSEWEGRRFDDITRSRFNEVEGQIRDLEELVKELEKREASGPAGGVAAAGPANGGARSESRRGRYVGAFEATGVCGAGGGAGGAAGIVR